MRYGNMLTYKAYNRAGNWMYSFLVQFRTYTYRPGELTRTLRSRQQDAIDLHECKPRYIVREVA